MEGQIWRLYDAIERTSIMCESQEECEHLISKFVETAKHSFLNNCEDYEPFYSSIKFIDEDFFTPTGYECKVTARCKIELPNWGTYFDDREVAHYFYYHDRDEEAERERIEKERIKKEFYEDTDSVSAKKPYVPPTLTAIVRGEVCRFVAETASPTDWTEKSVKTEPDKHLETLIDMLEHVLDSARGYKTTNTRCGWVVEIPMEFDNFKDLIKTVINELYPF